MLKVTIFLLVGLLTICYGMPGNHINLEAATVKLMLFKMMKEKCYQNATGSEYESFMNLTDNSLKCLQEKARKVPIFVTPVQDFKDNIQECVNDMIIELEECLPEESKDWPQLNFDIAYSIIDFVYENKNQILSPKFRSYIENCVVEFQNDNAKIRMSKCFSGYESNSVDAATLCETMNEIGNCTMTELDNICPGDADTEELKQNFLITLKEPCAEYGATDNPSDLFTLLAPYAPPNMNPELM